MHRMTSAAELKRYLLLFNTSKLQRERQFKLGYNMAILTLSPNLIGSKLFFRSGRWKVNGSRGGGHLLRPGIVVASANRVETDRSFVNWRNAGTAAVLSAALCLSPPALADLNKYEAAAGGEFGNGTAQQFGEADLRGRDFHGEVCIQHCLLCLHSVPGRGSSIFSMLV